MPDEIIENTNKVLDLGIRFGEVMTKFAQLCLALDVYMNPKIDMIVIEN